jgi:hypothetical protein
MLLIRAIHIYEEPRYCTLFFELQKMDQHIMRTMHFGLAEVGIPYGGLAGQNGLALIC